MSVQYRWYIVTGRCVPEGMVRIEGLDRFLTSIRRRVKHVKGSSSIDFGGRERLLNPNSLTLTQINVVRGAEPIVVRATSMLHSYSKSMKSFITCDEAICNSWWV